MEMEKPTESDNEILEIDEIAEEEESKDDSDEVSYEIKTLECPSVMAAPTAFACPIKRFKVYPSSSNFLKIGPKPYTTRTNGTGSSTVGTNEQSVITNSQPARLANQSILKVINKTDKLAAKPECYPPGTVMPKSTGRFIVKSSNDGQSIIFTAPPMTASTTSVATTYSTGTVSNIWKPSLPMVRPMGIPSSAYNFNCPGTAVSKPSSSQSDSNSLVMSLQTSTRPNTTTAVPLRLRTATSNRHTQKISIQAGGAPRQVMLPAHLYKFAQQIGYAGNRMQRVRSIPGQTQISAASLACVKTTPHPINQMKTFSTADCSVGTSIMKPINFQKTTPYTVTTSTRVISPMKQKAQQPSSTGGYRLLNSIDKKPTGAIAKTAVVNKFETFGSAQYAKNQRKNEHVNETDFLLSFGSPRKYIQIHHDFTYKDGQFYQNLPSCMATITTKSVTPPPPIADARSDGVRRKPCNCTKSHCLKLYCDCFANGEFCQLNCKCKECSNNLENEEERENAIQICLERNPMAFKPKIGQIKDHTDTMRRHKKGCNCKRSGCLKNYCECHEAKVACSENCKCTDCRNIADADGIYEPHSRTATNSSNSSMAGPSGSGSASMLDNSDMDLTSFEQHDDLDSPSFGTKKPCKFLTSDVIDAAIQCTIAQADECQMNNLDKKNSERLILEEFGRCLVEIIEFSLKPTDNSDK